MTPRQKTKTLRALLRAGWKDGFVAAWLIVVGLSAVLSGFGARWEWLAGAFFGTAIGLTGGYLVTVQRNYRRTHRELFEWQLANMKQLELRMIARGEELALDHLRAGRAQLEHALEELR